MFPPTWIARLRRDASKIQHETIKEQQETIKELEKLLEAINEALVQSETNRIIDNINK